MRSVLSVSLSESLASELDRLARRSGRSKGDIVKESLSQYLWESRFRKVRKRLVVKSKRAGLISEDDVFRAVS
jgi:predicted transcriptional regulator